MIGLTNVQWRRNFVWGDNSLGSIGDEIGSPYDIFKIDGNSGTAAGHQQVATLDFIVGAKLLWLRSDALRQLAGVNSRSAE